ncbi:MAG: S1C family serine protease [bacterium]
MPKNILKIIIFFVIGMVGGIFADQILWPYFIERPLFYEYRLEQNPVYLTDVKEIFIQENTALSQAVEKVKETVVGVRAKAKTGEILEGSGLIITYDGLMVTLAELVPQGSDFSFFVGGKPVSFQVLKRNSENNLALVKLEETNLPTVGFGNFEKIKLGERIFLVGAVFDPLAARPQPVVNTGIIRSLGQDFIETNIFEKSGLKGSPLFDIEGNVLGINSISPDGRVMAIPVSQIKAFIGM